MWAKAPGWELAFESIVTRQRNCVMVFIIQYISAFSSGLTQSYTLYYSKHHWKVHLPGIISAMTSKYKVSHQTCWHVANSICNTAWEKNTSMGTAFIWHCLCLKEFNRTQIKLHGFKCSQRPVGTTETVGVHLGAPLFVIKGYMEVPARNAYGDGPDPGWLPWPYSSMHRWQLHRPVVTNKG